MLKRSFGMKLENLLGALDKFLETFLKEKIGKNERSY